MKAVKREETLESVSQGSTAASRGFFAANYSDDENSEPDFGLSLRGPPGLCQQASWRPTSCTSCLLAFGVRVWSQGANRYGCTVVGVMGEPCKPDQSRFGT